MTHKSFVIIRSSDSDPPTAEGVFDTFEDALIAAFEDAPEDINPETTAIQWYYEVEGLWIGEFNQRQ